MVLLRKGETSKAQRELESQKIRETWRYKRKKLRWDLNIPGVQVYGERSTFTCHTNLTLGRKSQKTNHRKRR